MAKYVVLVDIFNWSKPVPGTTPTQYEHHTEAGGTVLEDLPQSAVDFGLKLGAIAEHSKAKAAQAAHAALDEPLPEGEEGDEQLAGMNAAELIAYVTQHAGERDRVWGLEQARAEDARRVTVAKAAGYDLATGEPLEND